MKSAVGESGMHRLCTDLLLHGSLMLYDFYFISCQIRYPPTDLRCNLLLMYLLSFGNEICIVKALVIASIVLYTLVPSLSNQAWQQTESGLNTCVHTCGTPPNLDSRPCKWNLKGKNAPRCIICFFNVCNRLYDK